MTVKISISLGLLIISLYGVDGGLLTEGVYKLGEREVYWR